jgi:quinol monooxygenase YgiN
VGQDNITVVYKWTANAGKLDELTAIYKNVTTAMQENEPGATAVHVFVSEQDNSLYVRDEFADANALGYHLSQTAAAHFPALLEIATPKDFRFFGNVPEEVQQATLQMGLAAEFAGHVAGFDR